MFLPDSLWDDKVLTRRQVFIAENLEAQLVWGSLLTKRLANFSFKWQNIYEQFHVVKLKNDHP